MKLIILATVIMLILSPIVSAESQATPIQKGLLNIGGAGLRFWNPSLSGGAGTNNTRTTYRQLDLEADSQISAFPFWPGEGCWRIGADLFDYKNSTLLSKPHELFGTTITGSVRSRLDIRSVNLYYLPKLTDNQPDSFTLIYGAKAYSHKLSLTSDTAKVKRTFNGIFPVFGFRLDRNKTGPTSWHIEAVGIPGSSYIFDAEAALKQQVSPNTTISAGYRTISQAVNDDSERLSYRLAGPFAEIKHLF